MKNIRTRAIESEKQIKDLSISLAEMAKAKHHAQRIIHLLELKLEKRSSALSHLKGKLGIMLRQLIDMRDGVTEVDLDKVIDELKIVPKAVIYKPRVEGVNLSDHMDSAMTIIVWRSQKEM